MDKEVIRMKLEGLRDKLADYRVKKIFLFGSYIRNEHDEDSDIDLLVELDDLSYDNFITLVQYLEQEFNKEVNLVVQGSVSPYIEPYINREKELLLERR